MPTLEELGPKCSYHSCSQCRRAEAVDSGQEHGYEPQTDEYTFQRGVYSYTVRGVGTLGHFDYAVTCEWCEDVLDQPALDVEEAIRNGDRHVDYKHSAAWPVTLPIGELPHDYLPLFQHALVVINNHVAGRFIKEIEQDE